MARRSGTVFMGNRVSIRNAYARSAAEEIRAMIQKYTPTATMWISSGVETVCNDFVQYGATYIPVKTGNLADSFGVGVYVGDVLRRLFQNPQIAQKPVRTGYAALAPVATVLTKYGNVREIISGKRELEAMSSNKTFREQKINKFISTKNVIRAVMYIAAPYARSVPEKGHWGTKDGAINKYYESLEDAFEFVVVRELQDMFNSTRQKTTWRKRHGW